MKVLLLHRDNGRLIYVVQNAIIALEKQDAWPGDQHPIGCWLYLSNGKNLAVSETPAEVLALSESAALPF